MNCSLFAVNKSTSITINQSTQGTNKEVSDEVAVEEPLEFHILFGSQASREQKNIAITMRTPGKDFQLVLGFLYSEGIIQNIGDVIGISRIDDLEDHSNIENTVLVELDEALTVDLEKIRNFYINSSCGICGSQVIENIGSLKQYAFNSLYVSLTAACFAVLVALIVNFCQRVNPGRKS